MASREDTEALELDMFFADIPPLKILLEDHDRKAALDKVRPLDRLDSEFSGADPNAPPVFGTSLD